MYPIMLPSLGGGTDYLSELLHRLLICPTGVSHNLQCVCPHTAGVWGVSIAQAVPVGGQMLEELAQNRSGSLWINRELNSGLNHLWQKWTVSQDHVIAEGKLGYRLMKYEILGRGTESFGPLQTWSSQSLLKIALRQTEVFWCHATMDCDGVVLYSQIK